MQLEKIIDPDDLPEEPWQNKDLLWHLYREREWSQRTIAFELAVDKQKVLKGLIQNNVLQPWADKETLESALEDGHTPADIAEAWNCSELSIRRWMEKHEIRKRTELTEDLLHELHDEQKLTCEEIADDLGYSPVEVHFALEEHGINRRDGSHRFR